MTTSAAPTPKASLSDCIFDLAARADRPREDAVVMLHEANNGAHFGKVLHGRLHVAGAVHRAARNVRGTTFPVPRKTEARQAFVDYRIFQPCFLPGLAAVGGDVDRPDPAIAGPGKALDLLRAG